MVMNSFILSIQTALSQVFLELLDVFPRVLGAVIILWLGLMLAEWVRRVMMSLFASMSIGTALKNTPVEHFIQSIGLETIENVLSRIVYWLLVLVIAQTSVSVLGLITLSNMFDSLFGYIPHILSALVVLLLGIGVAGFAESFMKQATSSLDVHTSRLAGKVTSYVVVVLAALIAISELGIARDFILIIFIGFVTVVALGGGLALGLGGQSLVQELLEDWYSRVRTTKKKNSK